MFSTIISILLKIPTFISIAEKICGLIAKEIEIVRQKQALKQMKKACEVSKETKDTSQLENIFSNETTKN